MNEITLPGKLLEAEPAAEEGSGVGPSARCLAGSTAVFVLGMHRSGTSALAGLLSHLGVTLGDRLMPASPDNPKGYWEHRDVVPVHDGLLHGLGSRWDDIRPLPPGWEDGDAAGEAARRLQAILRRDFGGIPLWGLKDPRLCRLMPLWAPLLRAEGIEARFVLALRNPREVAASLRSRDGMSPARAALLWLRHVLEAERASRGQRRGIVHYEDLLSERGWRSISRRLQEEIGVAWPANGRGADAEVEAFLAPELRHNRAPRGAAPAVDRIADAKVEGWVETVYGAFVGGDDARLAETCRAVSRELARADEIFGDILAEVSLELGAARDRQEALERRIGDLAAERDRASHEARELRAVASRQDTELKELRRHAQANTPRFRQPLGSDEAFPKWVESRTTTAASKTAWLAERVAQWPFMPKLALGMILPAGIELRVALTLRSLLTQVLGDWELHVVAEGDMPEPFKAESRLFWHRRDGARPAEALNRVLLASNAPLIALIDAGDQLAPHALFAVGDALFRHPEWLAFYSDEDRIDQQDVRSAPHFKPDFNLDLMRSMPYVGGLLAVRRELFAEIGGFDPDWDGVEEYALSLRLAERLGADAFGHVADILYHRLIGSGRSLRPMEQICADMPRAVRAHLDRLGIKAVVETGAQPHFCRVVYQHDGPEPLVSIIIPTKNQLALLKRCIEAVLQKTRYQNYEIIVVDNGSDEEDAVGYLRVIEEKYDDIGSRVRVLRHPGAFNYSVVNNRAVREAARGEYICLLNNDAAPLDGAWLGEMMQLARRPDVGVVGAKLFYPDGHIQHGGVILGVGWGSPADHPYNREPGNAFGYWGRLQVVQDFSAVTAACMVTRRSVYEQVNGLDEGAFAVAYNDVDYCLKVRQAGFLVAWTPYALLLHESSASLKSGVELKSIEEKNARFARERDAMYARWMPLIAFDPAYNRNLSSVGFGFSIETEGAPSWDPEFRPRERVLVYPADRDGCGEYRIIAPSRALFRSGVLHSYETMRLLTPPEIARMAPDSIVFQRQLEWKQIEVIEVAKKTSKAFRVFELDDLITNLPVKSAYRTSIAADIGQRLRKAVSLCDRMVVSTEPLAREYAKLCDEVVVLPNRLEKPRWLGLTPKRRLEGKARVGWAGAVGHLGDLMLIESVLEATCKDVDWVFFGMCPEKLKPYVKEVHGWVPLDDYARKLASLDLDLAVAPLEYHPFNEAKSNLRLLEYGILGYPVVCTDIVPYQCDLPVVRVKNRHRDWMKAILDMISDRDACRRAGEGLREKVLQAWILEDHLAEWKKAWLP